MPEDNRSPRRRRARDGEARERDGDGARERRPGPSGPQLALRARSDLSELTGLEPESVTALERRDDGTWTVTIEMLELSRIPETDDVLGSYEIDVSADGEILGYRRTARYPRSHAYEAGARR